MSGIISVSYTHLDVYKRQLFAAGTAVAGLAGNFTLLLIARILQAMAAGILMPMIQTVILLLFPKEKRGAAMGTIGIVIRCV